MVRSSSGVLDICVDQESQLVLSFCFHRYTIFKDHVTLEDCILFNNLKKKKSIYLFTLYRFGLLNHDPADEIHDGMNLELYYQ